MQYTGPVIFLAVAARTVLVDPAAAEAYLTRLRRSGGGLDQLGARLRAGAGKGRLPPPRSSSRPSSGPRLSWPHPASARWFPPGHRGAGPERRRGKKNAGRPPKRC